MTSILIVEDEQDIRELLAFNFTREGFAVHEAADGLTALEKARQPRARPDLILLDIMLPGLDGLGVCKELQRDSFTSTIPIIMLTAKGEEIDRIVGLELGVSDYIVKPFSMREVILRVRAVLRRTGEPQDGASLRCGEVALHPARHLVEVVGQPVDLTVTEFRLLEDLLRHQGVVRTREQLLETVWGYTFDGYARTVDTHIRRLRAKLGAEAERVETVRGVGYRAQGVPEGVGQRKVAGGQAHGK